MKFVILCPDNYTGGPFALLQLNDCLNLLGYQSEVLFYNLSKMSLNSNGVLNVIYERLPSINIENIDYKLCKEVHQDDVIVVPEVQLELLVKLKKSGFNNCVAWWLSWDNAPIGCINRFDYINALRGSINIFQSNYAQHEAAKFGLSGPIVSDYTFFQPEEVNKSHRKVVDICYLPRKAMGAELVIFELQKRYSIVRIENMSQSQVREVLKKSRFFLDFGQHPGKDRIPREAALLGCVPVVRKAGAANFMEDVYLPSNLKIELDIICNPEILGNYLDLLEINRSEILRSIYPYRRRIMSEFDNFKLQVADFCGLFFGS